MTQEDTSVQSEVATATTETPANDTISRDQWQAFLGNLTAQNQQLQAQLAQTQGALGQVAEHNRKQAIDQLTPEQKAQVLENELNQIKANAQNAQQNQISHNAWQQRDAESAARILNLHGLSGYEPELYRNSWDVNWMPRFVASVEGIVKTKGSSGKNPASNPANRANVGNGNASSIPELDPNASGFDTIRYALSRAKG